MGTAEFLGAMLGIAIGFSVVGVIVAIKISGYLGDRIDILSKRVDDLTFKGR